mmetsp:Transcript_107005/g.301032  ORF Transcript_107005/g.301032 Transcript_107005/m.301032 type:complete len:263 (+) Transcript_107005:413-1201(+)
MVAFMQPRQAMEPAIGDALLACTIGDCPQILRVHLCESIMRQNRAPRRPLDISVGGRRVEKRLASLGAIKLTVSLGRVLCDSLHHLLERHRLLNPQGLKLSPLEVKRTPWVEYGELEHGAKDDVGRALASHRVYANDRRVNVHVTQDLVVRAGVPGDDLGEILFVLHCVQDVRLHDHVTVLGAVVHDRVLGYQLAREAILPLAEVDVLARANVPQVADTLIVCAAVLHVDVVVEEEHTRPGAALVKFRRVARQVKRNCRDHL